jgi:type II secretory pathway component GspD/PulD (secretin)/beta-lactamase regulating signal transducer with metallopeptidase domain
MTTFIETLNHWGDHFLNFAWPMLWQSSLLIAIIFVLEFALRRKIRAAIRYALWLMVLVKLLLPPSLALPTSPTWWIHPFVPPTAKAPPVSFTVSYGEQMTPDFALPPSPVIPPPKAPVMSFAAWTLAASGVVSAGLLAWLLVRWRQINQKVRRAQTSAKLIPVLDEARRLTRLRPGIRLKLTEDSMSPAVCGLFRPVILLPQSLVDRLSIGQLRAVLLHEAIHLRRGDVWANCAQAVLQIVYWWHPLLWLANARIRRVREEAVDDAVMLALRDDAEIYAPTLLEVAKLAFNRPLASLGLVGILESRSALRQRIERLVNFNAPRKAGLTVVSMLGILAFSAVALPMGEAPEKTNAPTPISQPNDNGPTATNVVDSKIEADKLIQNGKLLYEKGHFREAETNFNQALKLDPENPRSFYYLSLVKQVIYAREEHNGTNSVADSRVLVPNAWSPEVGIGLPVPNPYVTNNDIHTSFGREVIYRKLNQIHLESVSWSNSLPLSEVIRYLAEQSKLQDPDKKGINFMFNPNVATSAAAGASNLINPTTGLPVTPATNAAPETVDASAISVKLTLNNNTSLRDVLDAVVRGADRLIRYTVEDFAVVFSVKPPGPEPPILEMRAFKVTAAFFAALKKLTNLQTTDIAAMAESHFRKQGVDLTAPGRSIAYGNKLGLLFVRATPPELDAIERVIQELNEVAPQIHIKARFIEVPEGQMEAILKAGTVVDTKQTNVVEIIAADKMKSLLHQLESSGGVVALAEPEAVTASLRQVLMRTDNATVDLVPALLSDGYSINLTLIPQDLESLRFGPAPVVPGYKPMFVTSVNIWDNQTVVLGGLVGPSPRDLSPVRRASQSQPKTSNKKNLMMFVTATIVDPAGNRVHSDDELRQMQAKAKADSPPQNTSILSDTNFQARVHALEQRTGVENLAEPEPVTTAGRGANRINRMVVPDKIDIPTLTTNAAESAKLVQDGKLLYEMGKFEEAGAKLNQALKLDPANPGAFYYLSLIQQANFAREEHNRTTQAANSIVEVPKAWAPKVSYGLPVPNPYAVNTNVHTNASSDPNLPQLEMRVFKVDPNAFASGLRGIQNLQTNDVVTMAKSFFSQLGVDLSKPGRSIAINDGLGLLFVKATPSELDTIERVIQALNQVAPQIHIKARFIEVEQDYNPARGFDWYLGSFSNGPVVANGRSAPSVAVPVSAANPLGSFPGNTTTSVIPTSATDQQLTSGLRNTVPVPATVTGILTDPNFRVTLYALESRPRTKILAEPEAVTTSGRRTQMRATDIQTVPTGINPLALKSPGVSSNELFLTKQVECGPVFDVVPYVLSDGYTLNLTTTASVTEFLGYDNPTNSVTVYINGKKQTAPVPLPKFRTQKISTVVNLWDNQTLVLGGPVTSAVQTTKNKVPLLGDLPLVGGLFRSQTENSVEKKLMVFVTATIVDPAGNRVHSDDELPFKPNTVPPQPQLSTPSR